MRNLTEDRLIKLYQVFFNNYVEVGKQWISIFEVRNMLPQSIDGKIVLWVRDWLNYLDGIAILYSYGNTYAARNLLRSCWEIYIQFKFFLVELDQQVISDKILCIDLVEIYKSIIIQDKYYQELIKKGQVEDASFLKQYLQKYQEIYTKNQFLNKDRGELYKKFYQRSLKGKRNYKWYGLYLAANKSKTRANSINALARNLYTLQGSSLGDINELIYGMLSSQAHGSLSGDGFYRDGDLYRLMPLRHIRGAGLAAMCVQVMFEDMWETMEAYFQGRVEVRNQAIITLLKEQKQLVEEINLWDKELTCLKVNDCT